MKRFLLRWGPALAVMLIIFLFSSQPKGTLPDFGGVDFWVKKFAHTLVYMGLSVAMLWGLRGSEAVTPKHALFALVLTVLYAMSDELHQRFVAGRDGQWFDVGVDTLGAMIGLALRLWLWPRLWNRFHRPGSPFQSKSE
jgi:VanZ family protein